MPENTPQAPGELELIRVLSALADPVRFSVIRQLVDQEADVERLCTSFGLTVSKSTRSYHFKVLRESGLITQVDRGNSSMARLRRSAIDAAFPSLLEAVSSVPRSALP